MPAPLVKIVPNVLSTMRLALALIYPLLPSEWRLPALIGGALSDWIDGLIARRYEATSASGTLLDAIADKVFTLSVVMTATISGEVVWWQVLMVLARDLAVAGVSAWCVVILRRPDAFRHMRPRLPGKVTTTLVFLWLIAVFADAAPAVHWTLFVLAGAGSIVAAADYLRVFVMRYAERESLPA